jgi:hypothetical protein
MIPARLDPANDTMCINSLNRKEGRRRIANGMI